MNDAQFSFSKDQIEVEVTVKIPLEPFIKLLNDKFQPFIDKPKPDIWLNPKEAAAYLLISMSTLRRWVKAGKLKFVRRGSRLLFKQSSLDEWNVEKRLRGIRY